MYIGPSALDPRTDKKSASRTVSRTVCAKTMESSAVNTTATGFCSCGRMSKRRARLTPTPRISGCDPTPALLALFSEDRDLAPIPRHGLAERSEVVAAHHVDGPRFVSFGEGRLPFLGRHEHEERNPFGEIAAHED